jgi:hypothetical protein
MAKAKKPKLKPINLNWQPSNQNALSDDENEYNHVTKDGAVYDLDKEINLDGKAGTKIAYRGKYNHAPQKDLSLGRRSITHRTIAEKLSFLVAGQDIEFKIKPEFENDAEAKTQLKEALGFLDLGLRQCRKRIANSLVYQSLSPIIITQGYDKDKTTRDPENNERKKVKLKPIWFEAKKSEEVRFSTPTMTKTAKDSIDFHFYHKDWCFDGKTRKHVKIPELKSIKNYLKLDTKDQEKQGYYVVSDSHKKARSQPYVSFALTPSESIFDNYYPLPIWKTDNSINDIHAEFEASCIRIDYLRNGLHVFAIVNVYSMQFLDLVNGNEKVTPDEEWADQLEVVQSLKRSHNSGKVIVNPIGTKDPEKDGVIEVKEIKLEFPYESYNSFSEQSRATILSAWGVAADLFGITKPEKNNLRSQEGFLKMQIIMLDEKINVWRKTYEQGINRILDHYELSKVETKIKPQDSNLLTVTMIEIAKEYMLESEVRDVFSLKDLEDEELEQIRNKVSQSKKTEKKVEENIEEEKL